MFQKNLKLQKNSPKNLRKSSCKKRKRKNNRVHKKAHQAQALHLLHRANEQKRNKIR